MGKMKLYKFTVEGNGVFPFDMLRYDQCWPATEANDIINLAPEHRSEIYRQTRRVTLCGIQPATQARWESFGWKVKAHRILA